MLDPLFILEGLLTDEAPISGPDDVDAVRRVAGSIGRLADAVRWDPPERCMIVTTLQMAGHELHGIWPKHRLGHVCKSQASMVRNGMLGPGVQLAERLLFLSESVIDALDLAIVDMPIVDLLHE